jgi:hypothetical protein
LDNVVLAGHRDTFFRPLSGVRAGDSIMLKTRDGEFEYVVEHPYLLSVFLYRCGAESLHRPRTSTVEAHSD